MDSLSGIEFKKIEIHFKEINSKRINKYDGENSALIYYSIIEHNRIIDSLTNQLNSKNEDELKKNEIILRFAKTKTDLKNKLNSITEYNTQKTIDSLFKHTESLEILPNFALQSELLSEKLNATKAAELLLNKIDEKTINEKKLKNN